MPARARPWIFPVLLLILAVPLRAQDWRHGQPAQAERAAAEYLPPAVESGGVDDAGMRALVERYAADRGGLERFYPVPQSALQVARFRAFDQAWLARLDALPEGGLGVEGRIDWQLLQAHLRQDLVLLARAEARQAELAAWLPFAGEIARLQEERQMFLPLVPAEAAATLAGIQAAAAEARRALADAPTPPRRAVAWRAVNRLAELNQALQQWFDFREGYDPDFGWWVREPFKAARTALDDHAKFLREKVLGMKPGEDEPIVGDPIGAEGLAAELAHEMIPYTPDELIAIAEREFAWCETEWSKVAQAMGLGDDWRAALERTKRDFVAPGEQPALIAAQAYEAIAFVTQRGLVTVPAHAIDTWRMSMMSPERQKVAPFFLGGERILVSFPTEGMSQEGKLDSLRANNRHFTRATVFHELIPGHHLQGWYLDRYQPHRRLFTTPFWLEGWALWWELRLWELGFARTPEDRAGMLFWRAHRAARILFSLNFHLGRWTPEQCIDFLVERVGHDRHTATGEVRRSFNGDYSPLYQTGYLMGAIQLRALFAELVTTGRMGEQAFHDAILRGGPMPIELVRARLTGEKLPRDFRPAWKFAGALPGGPARAAP